MSGQVCSCLRQCWPSVADVGPKWVSIVAAEFGPRFVDSTSILAEFGKVGRNKAKVTLLWANFGRYLADGNRTKVGRCWAVGRVKARFGRSWPISGRDLSNSGPYWPTPGQAWSSLTEFGLELVGPKPNLVHVGPKSDRLKFGPGIDLRPLLSQESA